MPAWICKFSWFLLDFCSWVVVADSDPWTNLLNSKLSACWHEPPPPITSALICQPRSIRNNLLDKPRLCSVNPLWIGALQVWFKPIQTHACCWIKLSNKCMTQNRMPMSGFLDNPNYSLQISPTHSGSASTTSIMTGTAFAPWPNVASARFSCLKLVRWEERTD